MIFLIFVAFLLRADLSGAICCDSIKSLMGKKIEANNTLCAAGNILPPDCCRDIANEVKKHIAAYKALCLNSSALCANPKPLGLESGEIPNGAITASSTYSTQYHANDARLKKMGSRCSWGPKSKINSWLQVDLGQQTIVTGIATQGTCFTPPEWVKSYSISYSIDGNNWSYYRESGNVKHFQANNDRHTIVTHSFKNLIYARYMRLWPKSWNGYPTMRLEYYGCRQ